MKQKIPSGTGPVGRINSPAVLLLYALTATLFMFVCGCKKVPEGDGAPPPAQVIHVQDMNLITIASKDASKFSIVEADKLELADELSATGTVQPDISREVPVISLANGRVVEIKARLDDFVKKGPITAHARTEP